MEACKMCSFSLSSLLKHKDTTNDCSGQTCSVARPPTLTRQEFMFL